MDTYLLITKEKTMKRKIIKIDEEKCNGCGLCIPDCTERALQVVDGKARLVNDSFCDGLGACIKACPQGAMTIEEREAEPYTEKNKLPCGCPGTMQKSINSRNSELNNWPIQLKLINPNAPYLKNADIVIAADCTAFAYPNFHQKFLKDKILIMLCPKLDSNPDIYVEKLANIFEKQAINSITLVHMEVPCCGGVEMIIKEAMSKSGENIIIKDYTVSINGELV